MSVKLSIIIPVYNVEKYLKTCLDSICTQTFSDYEVIIIDDGSTDASGEICDDFCSENSRFTVFHIENGGVSNARNYGVSQANGKYIMFVDSDDWLDSNMCSDCVAAIEGYNADFLICGNYNESSSGSTQRSIFKFPGEKIRFFSGVQYQSEIMIPTLGLVGDKLKDPGKLDKLTPVWARIYLKEIIDRNNIRFIDLAKLPSEALQFNFEYSFNSKSAVYLDEPLYHYRRNTTQSVTKLYKDDLISKWNWWFEYNKDYIKKHNNVPMLTEAFYSRVCCGVIPLGGNALKLSGYKAVRKEMKTFLSSEMLREAFANFEYNQSPFYWRIFFFSAKHKLVDLFYLMTWCMRKILKRRNEKNISYAGVIAILTFLLL